VSAIFLYVEKRQRVSPLRPIRAHQNPGLRLDAPVLFFPNFHPGDCQQKIRIVGTLAGTVDDASRRNEFLDGDRVGRVVGVILPGDPVNGCVEMSPRVFSAGEIIPIPGWTAAVIMGNLFGTEWPGCAKLRR